jgi:glycosyltransferase involved in cell wall biosynthesis
MKHKRILIFSTDDHLHPAGGAEQAMGYITERLPHLEFDLICAKLRPQSQRVQRVKNVTIYRLGIGVPKIDGIVLALFGYWQAVRLMKKNSYDLVWSIMASYGAFSAVRVKRRAKLPFVLTLQEGDSFEYIEQRVRWVKRSFQKIFEEADAIQAISEYLRQWGRDMGYRGARDRVIPNGVMLELFAKSYSSHEVEEKRKTFGFPGNAFVLMTSSRLVEKNAIEDVIKALSNLPKDVCLVICGDGDLRPCIERQILELGLTQRVKLFGFVPPTNLPLIMRASDAFIRPSVTEGLGTAFLEAMAARLPVIATRVGGIADFLEDGVTGFEVAVHSPDSIVQTVERVRSLSEEEKNKVLVTAETMVRQRYNWDGITHDMEKVFNEVSS